MASAHVPANPERGYFTRLFIILPKKPFFVFSSHLTRVGRLAISREDEESVIEVIENFENFAKSTAGKGLEGVTEQAARSLGEVGKAAAERGIEAAIKKAATYLAKLTLLSEENVKTGIQDYESMLEEQYRESFQKFMEMYRQELEKRQAEK